MIQSLQFCNYCLNGMNQKPFLHVLSTMCQRLEPLAEAYERLATSDQADRIVANIGDRNISLMDLEAVSILYRDFKDMETAALQVVSLDE